VRRLTVPAGALASDRVPLDEARTHHVRDVLRLRDDDVLEVVDGAGWRARARLTPEGLRVLERDEPEPPPRPEIAVLQGWAKGEKMDRVVRPVAELGARRFVPVRTARSVPRGGGKPARWRAVAEDALRVSGRSWRMDVDDVIAFDEVFDWMKAWDEGTLAVCFDGSGASGLSDLPLEPPARVAILIGPEGGFAPEERARVDAEGLRRVRLGSATLRTETAAPAVVAALGLGRWGAS